MGSFAAETQIPRHNMNIALQRRAIFKCKHVHMLSPPRRRCKRTTTMPLAILFLSVSRFALLREEFPHTIHQSLADTDLAREGTLFKVYLCALAKFKRQLCVLLPLNCNKARPVRESFPGAKHH